VRAKVEGDQMLWRADPARVTARFFLLGAPRPQQPPGYPVYTTHSVVDHRHCREVRGYPGGHPGEYQQRSRPVASAARVQRGGADSPSAWSPRLLEEALDFKYCFNRGQEQTLNVVSHPPFLLWCLLSRMSVFFLLFSLPFLPSFSFVFCFFFLYFFLWGIGFIFWTLHFFCLLLNSRLFRLALVSDPSNKSSKDRPRAFRRCFGTGGNDGADDSGGGAIPIWRL